MKMDCRQFEEILHDLARAAALEAETLEGGLAHARVCPECRERLAEAQSLTEALGALAAESAEAQAPPHLEANVLSAFRQRRQRPAIRWQPWAVAGVAAALLFAVALALPRWEFFSGTSPRQTAEQPAPPAPAVKPDVVSAPLSASSDGESSSPQQAPEDLNGAVWATDFVPVPFSDALMPDEDAAVVRVQMPRSELASLGFPVSEDGTEDGPAQLIQADLLIGQDGQPRAVRLIQ
jgi:anti-sigma factor RsiW